MPKPVILCVDDERAILETMGQQLESAFGNDYSIELAQTGTESLELLQELASEKRSVPLLIVDQIIPGLPGDQLIIKAQTIVPGTFSILLTGQASAEHVGIARNLGRLYRFLTKPWEADDLKLTVKAALKAYVEEQDLKRLRAQLELLNQQILSQGASVQYADQTEALGLLMEEAFPGAEVHVLAQHFDGRWYYTSNVQYKAISTQFLETKNLPDIKELSAAIKKFASGQAPKAHGKGGLYHTGPEHSPQLALEVKLKGGLSDAQSQTLALIFNQAQILLRQAYLQAELKHKVRKRTEAIHDVQMDLQASVRYAQRIQRAILPDLSPLHQAFVNHYVLYEPKAVVSGDFYWLYEHEGTLTYCLADATGTGIPAAFLSVLASSRLDQLMRQNPKQPLSELILNLDAAIAETLQRLQHSAHALAMDEQHGIEMSFARYSPGAQHLDVALVCHNLYYYTKPDNPEDSLTMLEHAGKAVGHGLGPRDIGRHKIPLTRGSRIFMATDGYLKQPGGKKLDPLGHDRFLDLLARAQRQPFEQQPEFLFDEHRAWRGHEPQSNDLLLLGIQL